MVDTGNKLRICDIDGCASKHHSGGLCGKHYVAHRRTLGIQPVSDRLCDEADCASAYYAKGLCKPHYTASRRPPPLIGPRRPPGRQRRVECQLNGCDQAIYTRGVCKRHSRGGRVDPSKAGGDFRDHNLRYKYGITIHERRTLFADQLDLCAICLDAGATDIDHDHSHQCADPLRAAALKRGCRDCIRGGLCTRCNVTLAVYEGDSEVGGAAELLSDPDWCAMADIHLKQRPFQTKEI